MKLIETKLSGVYIIETNIFSDERGIFIKIFNADYFKKMGLECDFKESFYSTSRKFVIRGMHFQIPPQDYTKLIYVTKGKIIDVVLDIRKGSATYGKYISEELSDKNGRCAYIPKGFAHGFLALVDNSTTVYMQTTVYAPTYDKGIRFDSFGMNWMVKKPIISERDKSFPKLEDFESPF